MFYERKDFINEKILLLKTFIDSYSSQECNV